MSFIVEEGGNMVMNLIMRRGSSLVEHLSLHIRRNFKSPGCSTHYTYIMFYHIDASSQGRSLWGSGVFINLQ